MKLPDNVNPAHCASKDDCRYVLQGTKFKNGMAYSTNGKILCVALAQLEDDDTDREAIVPTRAMLKAFPSTGKKKRGVFPRLSLKRKRSVVRSKEGDCTILHDIDGTFPSVEQVCQQLDGYDLKLTIGVKLLNQISKGLGSDALTIHIKSSSKMTDGDYLSHPLYVTGSSDEAFAILMPMRSSRSNLRENRALSKMLSFK